MGFNDAYNRLLRRRWCRLVILGVWLVTTAWGYYSFTQFMQHVSLEFSSPDGTPSHAAHAKMTAQFPLIAQEQAMVLYVVRKQRRRRDDDDDDDVVDDDDDEDSRAQSEAAAAHAAHVDTVVTPYTRALVTAFARTLTRSRDAYDIPRNSVYRVMSYFDVGVGDSSSGSGHNTTNSAVISDDDVDRVRDVRRYFEVGVDVATDVAADAKDGPDTAPTQPDPQQLLDSVRRQFLSAATPALSTSMIVLIQFTLDFHGTSPQQRRRYINWAAAALAHAHKVVDALPQFNHAAAAGTAMVTTTPAGYGTTAARMHRDADDYDTDLTGLVNMFQASADSTIHSVERMDVITIPLAFLILGLAVRSLLLMLIPIVVMPAAIMTTFAILYPIGERLPFASFAPPIFISLTIAMGVDYSLFLLTRYQEQRRRRHNVADSVTTMLRYAGHTIIVSGSTLVLCFVGMTTMPLEMVYTVGLGCSVTLAMVMLANVTIAPALLLQFPGFFERRLFTCAACVGRDDGDRRGEATSFIAAIVRYFEQDRAINRFLARTAASAGADASIQSSIDEDDRDLNSSQYDSDSGDSDGGDVDRSLADVTGFGRRRSSEPVDDQGVGGGVYHREFGSGDDDQDKAPPLTSSQLQHLARLLRKEQAKSLWFRTSYWTSRSRWRAVLISLLVIGCGLPVSLQLLDFAYTIDYTFVFPRNAPAVETFASLSHAFPPGELVAYKLVVATPHPPVDPSSVANHPVVPHGPVLTPTYFEYTKQLMLFMTNSSRSDIGLALSHLQSVNHVPGGGKSAPKRGTMAADSSDDALGLGIDKHGFISVDTAKLLLALNAGTPKSAHAAVMPDADHQQQKQNPLALLASLYHLQYMRLVNPRTTAGIIDIATPFDPLGDDAQEWIGVVRRELKRFRRDRLWMSRSMPAPGPDEPDAALFDIYLTGGACPTVDGIALLYSYFPIVVGVSLTVVFLLIAIVFNSLVVPVRVVFTLVFTLSWIFGAAVLVFEKGLLDSWFPVLKTSHAFQWLVPVMSFTVCTGLSLDYDIFFLTRVYEYRKLGFTDRAAIVKGIRATGSVITTAGVIMIVAFSSLMLTHTMMLQQMGFCICFAVFMDTFVVRTLLVPALMLLLDKYNFTLRWLPARWAEPLPPGTRGVRCVQKELEGYA